MRPNVSLSGWSWFVGCCCAVTLLATGVVPSDAAEREREYDFDLSKGLWLFQQERYGEAEPFLQEAFKAKPGDPLSGYYLGLSLIRLRRHQAAEDRFREVLQRHPDEARAHMGLGMALYHRGRFQESSAELAIAEPFLKDDPLLHAYAGLAAAKRQADAQAVEQFIRAGNLDSELAADPRYQQGLTLQGQGRRQEAVESFASALEGGADTKPAVRPAAGAMLSSPSKRWSALFGLSTQYDSNVVLLPSGTSPPGGSTGISDKDDFVTVITGSGEYRFVQNETWTVGAGYGFFQNLHARLSDFNVQDHTPTLYVQRRFGLAQLRLQYLLDYVTVGGDAYLLSNALQSTLTLPESDRTFTQAFVRYQYKDFKTFRDDQLGAPVNQTRDGVNWMVGAMQFWQFADGRGQVRGGYTFDKDATGGGDVSQALPGRPTNADWSYHGHRLSVGAWYRPLEATTVQASFDYYRQNYRNANSFSFSGTTVREDNIYALTGSIVRDLQSWLWVGFQYSYTRDQSNVAAFDYTRHIVSLTLGGAF